MHDVNALDIVETICEGVLVVEPDLTIRFANRSFYDTFAVAPEHTVGLKLYEIGNGQWCPASALVRQNWRLEEGRISGSS